MEYSGNALELLGQPVTAAELSHEHHGRRYYCLFLEVPRLSGAVDRLRVLLEERLLPQLTESSGQILVQGQLRSYNRRTEQGRHLVISALAESIIPTDGDPVNNVWLTGTLCRQPVYRRTPLGREICDGMLAVNRPYHRADYLPCIFWGRTAQEVSQLPVGTVLSIEGRLQSRDYVKQLDTGPETRTAYEVSVVTTELAG